MKIPILLLLIIVLAISVTRNDTKPISIPVTIDTLWADHFLNNPIDYAALKGITDTCVTSERQDSFIRIVSRCFFISDGDTLARQRVSVYKTDSTWIFGTNGYKLEYFECRDKRIRFVDALGVGEMLSVFERRLGPFDKSGEGVYTKTLWLEPQKFQLTLETEDDFVTGIVINVTDSVNIDRFKNL